MREDNSFAKYLEDRKNKLIYSIDELQVTIDALRDGAWSANVNNQHDLLLVAERAIQEAYVDLARLRARLVEVCRIAFVYGD